MTLGLVGHGPREVLHWLAELDQLAKRVLGEAQGAFEPEGRRRSRAAANEGVGMGGGDTGLAGRAGDP